MKLTLLGTGSPYPSLRRACSGYLLEVGDQKIVIDMGPGAFRNLLQTGVKLDEITHFFLSHLHFDHCQDFLRLYHSRWDRFRDSIPPLRLYGPPGFQRFMDLQFGREGAFGADILSRLEHPVQRALRKQKTGMGAPTWPLTSVVELRAGERVTDGGWTCSIEAVPHYEPLLVNHGFRFDTAHGSIAYTSDVTVQYLAKSDDGRLAGLIRLAEGTDILVHYMNGVAVVSTEADAPPAGIMPALAGELAQKAGVKTLVTTHHGPQMDGEETRRQTLDAIRATFSGRVVWGEDLMSFEV